MTPNQEHHYRRTSAALARWGVSATRRCPGCQKTRSATQFAPGKTRCHRCRGVR